MSEHVSRWATPTDSDDSLLKPPPDVALPKKPVLAGPVIGVGASQWATALKDMKPPASAAEPTRTQDAVENAKHKHGPANGRPTHRPKSFRDQKLVHDRKSAKARQPGERTLANFKQERLAKEAHAHGHHQKPSQKPDVQDSYQHIPPSNDPTLQKPPTNDPTLQNPTNDSTLRNPSNGDNPWNGQSLKDRLKPAALVLDFEKHSLGNAHAHGKRPLDLPSKPHTRAEGLMAAPQKPKLHPHPHHSKRTPHEHESRAHTGKPLAERLGPVPKPTPAPTPAKEPPRLNRRAAALLELPKKPEPKPQGPAPVSKRKPQENDRQWKRRLEDEAKATARQDAERAQQEASERAKLEAEREAAEQEKLLKQLDEIDLKHLDWASF